MKKPKKVKICDDCRHKLGDGHPYGDIKCGIDDKVKHETHKCDTGEYKTRRPK